MTFPHIKKRWLISMCLIPALAGLYFFNQVPVDETLSGWADDGSRRAGFVLEGIDVAGLNRTAKKDVFAMLDVEAWMPILSIDIADLR